MQKKNLVTFLLIFLLVFLVVFIGITQILGIPLWWIFGFLKPLSIVPQPKLLVTVSPETPLSVGERITVTVTNSSSQLPVNEAEVLLKKDGMEITLHTDSEGQAFFGYFGEVTVIIAQKTGIDSSTPIAIPKLPDAWVRGALISLGSAVVGGLVSGYGTQLFRERKGKTTKQDKKTKTKRE